MKNIMDKQHGIGFLGVCGVLVIIGFFVLLILRLFPLYNEKLIVINTMETIAGKPESVKLSNSEIRKLFIRNINVSLNRSTFNDETVKDFVKIEKDKKAGVKFLRVNYESRNEFIKDIHLLLEFDRRVELGKMADE